MLVPVTSAENSRETGRTNVKDGNKGKGMGKKREKGSKGRSEWGGREGERE